MTSTLGGETAAHERRRSKPNFKYRAKACGQFHIGPGVITLKAIRRDGLLSPIGSIDLCAVTEAGTFMYEHMQTHRNIATQSQSQIQIQPQPQKQSCNH